jgi:hypothetical protein
MSDSTDTLAGVVIPGLLAGAALSAVLAARSRSEGGSAVAPLNAPTHLVRGERAVHDDQFRAETTVPGTLINLGAGVFWAGVMEVLFGRALRGRGPGASLAAGAATSALVWLVDYHLIPHRLSPGFQETVSRQSLLAAHGAFALALGLGHWMLRRPER